MTDAATHLTELGFTGLEADIYLLLLQEHPATGYRVAQQLGKPTGNVYKALETLEQKGAILVDEGESRLVRPVDPSELLAQLDRRFASRRANLAGALENLSRDSEDHRLYSLRSYDQVLERMRAMLERCETVALLDLFPAPFAALRPDIERAIDRGSPSTSRSTSRWRGAEVAVSWTPEQTIDLWPGQAIHAVVDAREWTVALFAKHEPRVIQAVWSASRFLATTQFACLASDFLQAKMRGWVADGRTAAEIEELLESYEVLRLRHTPGFAEFRAHVAESAE
ncbi:MAG: helix-turn-helix domain-containing protein [Candidatus Eisenbacteria bacterium]